jgi:transcriptional regulator with XRE-family HTH domain
MSSVSEIERHIGRRLLAARRLRNVSQDALARSLGAPPGEIEGYEEGREAMTALRLHDVARALQVSESFFFEDLAATTSCPYSLPEEHYTMVKSAVRRIAADHELTPNGLRKKLALRDAVKFARDVCETLGWSRSEQGTDLVGEIWGAQHKAGAVEPH